MFLVFYFLNNILKVRICYIKIMFALFRYVFGINHSINPDINPLLKQDIRHIICTFLDIGSSYRMKIINKELLEDQLLYKDIFDKSRMVALSFMKIRNDCQIYRYFKGTFFPIQLIQLFPVLPFDEVYLGSTDYIDRIHPKSLNKPIMVGVDYWNRPFISIRYKYQYKNKKKMQQGKITVFQRFSDNKEKWVKCNTSGPLMNNEAGGLFSDENKDLLIKNICRLLSEKPIQVKEYMYDLQNDLDIKTYRISAFLSES
jgi:hypothetical protein